MMIYTLSGNPIPLARPRFGKNGTVYDSQSGEKLRHRFEVKYQHRNRPAFTNKDQLTLTIVFYMVAPLSMSRGRKLQSLNKPHNKKPDLSNLIKYVEDVCNEIIFADDAQIVEIIAYKQYSDVPRTEFKVEIYDGTKPKILCIV